MRDGRARPSVAKKLILKRARTTPRRRAASGARYRRRRRPKIDYEFRGECARPPARPPVRPLRPCRRAPFDNADAYRLELDANRQSSRSESVRTLMPPPSLPDPLPRGTVPRDLPGNYNAEIDGLRRYPVGVAREINADNSAIGLSVIPIVYISTVCLR